MSHLATLKFLFAFSSIEPMLQPLTRVYCYEKTTEIQSKVSKFFHVLRN